MVFSLRMRAGSQLVFVYIVQLRRCGSKTISSNPSADGYCGIVFSRALYLNSLAQTQSLIGRL